MSNREIKRVENNAPRIIIAPPTPSFPNGVKLLPGLNTLPNKYYQELMELTPPPSYKHVVGQDGQPKMEAYPPRYPGRKWLEEMQKLVIIHTPDGRRHSPQLTFYYEELPDREDGPEYPATLPSNEKAALALVNSVNPTPNGRKVLERWLGTSKGAVASAIRTKLHGE